MVSKNGVELLLKVYSINHSFNHAPFQNDDSKLFHNKNTSFVKVIETFSNSNSLYVLYERQSYTLSHYFKESTLQNNKNRLLIFKKIVQIVQSIHKNDYIHGDLNQYTIFLDSQLNPLLSDFFYLKNDSHDRITRGLITYMDTSILKNISDKTDKGSDIYALGILLYQFFHKGKLPFQGSSLDDIKRMHRIGNYKVSQKVDIRLIHLIHACLNFSSKSRPDINILSEMLDRIIQDEKTKLIFFNFTLSNKVDLPNWVKQKIANNNISKSKSVLTHSTSSLNTNNLHKVKSKKKRVIQKQKMKIKIDSMMNRLHSLVGKNFNFKEGCLKDDHSTCEAENTRNEYFMPIICAFCMLLSFGFGTLIENRVYAFFLKKKDLEIHEKIEVVIGVV
jgi:serine/threonine protein kinase